MLKRTLTLGGQLLILCFAINIRIFFTVKTDRGNLTRDDSEKFL